jgi:hypothetical protein
VGAEIPVITDEYEVLHHDGMPILFTGVNRYTNRIVGSFVEEDDDKGIERFFHVMVSPSNFTRFLNRDMTYRALMEESGLVHVIDRKFDGEEERVHLLRTGQIPASYLPTEDSFCPARRRGSSFDYVPRLQGALANRHVADPKVLSRILESGAEFLKTPFLPIKSSVSIEATPFAEGSFQFKLTARAVSPQMDLFKFDYAPYVTEFIEFCLIHFKKESAAIARREFAKAPHFRQLLQAEKQLPEFQGKRAEELEAALLDAVEEAIRHVSEIAEVVGDKVPRIELFNDSTKGLVPVGEIDRNSAAEHEQAVATFSSIADAARTDSAEHEYDILVYSFNAETGIGGAYVFEPNSSATPKAKLVVTSDGSSLDNSPYTHSLDRSERIKVMAKASRNKRQLIRTLYVQHKE